MSVAILYVLCWALIFILKLRFPRGQLLADDLNVSYGALIPHESISKKKKFHTGEGHLLTLEARGVFHIYVLNGSTFCCTASLNCSLFFNKNLQPHASPYKSRNIFKNISDRTSITLTLMLLSHECDNNCCLLVSE